MNIDICQTREELGNKAAELGAKLIREAIAAKGQASIIVATGASQFATLAALIKANDIDWRKVTGFHLDEYIGLGNDHPASFCGYLKQRFVDQVPLKKFHYINGLADSKIECERLAGFIKNVEIDVAFIGIGENAHLAFNDPPADFETTTPYIVVQLDEHCRRQQSDEGWFAKIDDVPTQAISMSVQQILKSQHIVCSVPDARKAKAVKACLESSVSPDIPASILQQHPDINLFLDRPAASLLELADLGRI